MNRFFWAGVACFVRLLIFALVLQKLGGRRNNLQTKIIQHFIEAFLSSFKVENDQLGRNIPDGRVKSSCFFFHFDYDDPMSSKYPQRVGLPAEWFWRQPTFIPFSEDRGMLGGSSDLVSSCYDRKSPN